jgi:hypothetical protein
MLKLKLYLSSYIIGFVILSSHSAILQMPNYRKYSIRTINSSIFIAFKSIILLLCIFTSAHGQDFSHQGELYWHVNDHQGVTWDITNESRLPHDDNIEMSGTLVSGIIRYKVDQAKQVHITRDIIFPQLRNYTRSTESMYRAYLCSRSAL